MTANALSCTFDCIVNEECLSKIRVRRGKHISVLKVFSILNKGGTTPKLKSPL